MNLSEECGDRSLHIPLQKFGIKNSCCFDEFKKDYEVVYLTENKNKPTNEITKGNVKVSMWEKEHEKDGKKFKTKTFTAQRFYKDGEEWKYTNSFNLSDVPKLIIALQEAFNNAITKKEE